MLRAAFGTARGRTTARGTLASLAALGLAGCAARAAQQEAAGSVPSLSWRQCAAAVPASALTGLDTIYLRATVPDGGAAVLLPEADTLAARVGYEVRLLLGGDPSSLPPGEPTVTWADQLDGRLEVVAHRDGRATWRAAPPRGALDSGMTALLSSAMSAVATAAPLRWPANAGPDSVVVQLVLAPYHSRVTAGPGESGLGYLAFVRRVPSVEQRPRILTHLPLETGDLPSYDRVDDHLVMEAIVGTNGRVEPESIRELPHSSLRPPVPVPPEEHYQLVQSARSSLLSARFAPGRIGGCPVRVRVEIPFNFTFRHPLPTGPANR